MNWTGEHRRSSTENRNKPVHLIPKTRKSLFKFLGNNEERGFGKFGTMRKEVLCTVMSSVTVKINSLPT